MGQAALYLPRSAWPTRAAAAKRGRRRLTMSAIVGQQMDPHGLRPAVAKGRTRLLATRRHGARSSPFDSSPKHAPSPVLL
jgi:hypothetical protein